MYLTYDEYRARGGTLAAGPFARLAGRAARLIDAMTRGRLRAMAEPPGAVRDLTFELVALAAAADPLDESLFRNRETDIADGVHSARGYGPDRAGAVYRAMERAVLLYLAGERDAAGVPLLYLG